MTETEEEEFWYSNPWHNIKIPRTGHKVTYIEPTKKKLEKDLASLEVKQERKGYKVGFGKIKSFLKKIKLFKRMKKMKVSIKRFILNLSPRKYKRCILVFRAKGLTDEEILQEFLTS